MLLAKLRFDPSRSLIARAAGRAMVGSINFSISNLIQMHLRQQKFGVAVPEASGVDGANEALAAAAEAEETARVRVEQGFSFNMPPLEQAQLLKVIRNAIADDLEQNAARKALLTQPGKDMADPFHVAGTFTESLDFQSKLAPRVNEAVIKAEAKALNVSEQDIRDALVSRHQRQLTFLRENRADIVKIYNDLAVGYDGDDETAWDKLPAMVRLRLAASADKGLFSARKREIERHMSGNPDAKGNLGLIDGTRREILDEVARWMETQAFRAEVDEAISRGGNMPQFAPAPHVQLPDEKEEALRKHAA